MQRIKILIFILFFTVLSTSCGIRNNKIAPNSILKGEWKIYNIKQLDLSRPSTEELKELENLKSKVLKTNISIKDNQIISSCYESLENFYCISDSEFEITGIDTLYVRRDLAKIRNVYAYYGDETNYESYIGKDFISFFNKEAIPEKIVVIQTNIPIILKENIYMKFFIYNENFISIYYYNFALFLKRNKAKLNSPY